ncbi:MAG: hypothetical protein IJX46_09915 [Clostridia bacterium]|nr:hypothetical protein [Clostridia bacterium]
MKRIEKELIPVCFEEALSRADGRACFFDESYIRKLQAKTDAFPNTVDAIVESAKAAAADTEAARYAHFVSLAMEDRASFNEHLSLFAFPEDEHPMLALLCFLPHIDRLFDRLTALSLPSDVLRDTLRQFEDCIFLHEERFGRLGFAKRYFDHMQRYVDMRILNIGRLRFEIYKVKDACVVENRESGEQTLFVTGGEMNSSGLLVGTPPEKADDVCFNAFFEETETEFVGTPADSRGRCVKEPLRLSKDGHFLRVPEGADCISVHIPAKGALTREACEESYARAKKIFSELYPERDFKAFRCHSWMMAPELEGLLKPGSNLLEFQRPYIKYPVKTRGEDVLNFVFKLKFTSYADLPEDTSLQRALKQVYLSGGYLYEYNGLFTI